MNKLGVIFIVIFIVIFGLLLYGCSDDKPVVEEPHSPQELNLTTLKPPMLHVSASAGKKSTFVELGKYCWEEGDKICAIERNDPQELLLGLSAMSIEQGQKISFGFSTSSATYPDQLIEIDKIELVQFYKSEESDVEVIGRDFNAPEEKGRYYYLAKLRWDGEITGEANFAFSLSVQ